VPKRKADMSELNDPVIAAGRSHAGGIRCFQLPPKSNPFD
jgi:hypothetical protein